MNSITQLSTSRVNELKALAREARIKVLRMIDQAQSGHPAGSLGMAEIMVALYFEVLNIRPNQPQWSNRDYLFLSNGHICPILYACLNMRGFFPAIQLHTLRQLNSKLQGHPKYGLLNGIENTSGSLGQGLSQACGVALALKRDKKTNRVFCIMSDGEQQEGQVWEAYQFIHKYQLTNLVCIIDRNKIQIEGETESVMPLGNLDDKIRSFELNVIQIDGHHFPTIITSLHQAIHNSKPTAIIANTTAGKGVSFMENNYQWHGKVPNKTELSQAVNELEQT